MQTERFGTPPNDFWEIVHGFNAGLDTDQTVKILSADQGVQCTLRWATMDGVDEATVQEVKAFLADRMCQTYGFDPAQCDAALGTIEQTIKEEREYGEA